MTSRTGARVIDHDDVLRGAVHLFVETGALDIDELASRLHVGRATVYRNIRGIDALLGDVLWVLTERTLRMAERQAAGSGVDRILAISAEFHDLVQAFEPLQTFTAEDPDRAYRVLFTPAGRVHERTVDHWTALLCRAHDEGELHLPFAADQFAEMFVRLGESMLWSHLVGSVAPDRDEWNRVRRSMFSVGRT